jgi:hypothetical protein
MLIIHVQDIDGESNLKTGGFMTDLNAVRARVERIPIFKTLNYRIEALSEGEATLTAPYDLHASAIWLRWATGARAAGLRKATHFRSRRIA